MSTKAIREALEYLREIPDLTAACRGYADRGLMEVEAIERAAKAMKRLTLGVPQDLLTTDEQEAVETVRAIAKGAP